MNAKKLLPFLIAACATVAYADAPVVDLNQNQPSDMQAANQPMVAAQTVASAPSMDDSSNYAAIDTSRMPVQQRLRRLEQQMNTQMNSANRIDQLQQQVQQLQGQLEMQTHELQTLQNQQKTFYDDINQRLAQGKPAASSNVAANAAAPASASDESAYQKAFTLLTNKKYDQAATALQHYLKQFPEGKYLANAHYWLGEIYFMQNKQDLATQEFQTVIAQFPKDKKIPDALFKIAMIHDNAGKHTQARTELKQITKQYPESPAARLAAMRLKTMAQE